MPQMPCPKIVAFVEGSMEQMFINFNFNHVRVVSVSNGIGWTTDALAEQIVTLYKARDYHDWWVVVWVDRERRQETTEEIENNIRSKLYDAGASESATKVLVSDRMIENVILADQKFIASFFSKPDYVYSHCGSGGKRILSQFYQEIGINYKETKHGVAALKKIRLYRAAENCAAVHRFVHKNPLICWWINDDNEIAAA